MKRIIYSSELKLNNTCIAIGKFDGIHKGHSMILDWLVESKSKGCKTVVFTFQKTNSGIFNKDKHKFILTEDETYRIYAEKGIDYVIECKMDDSVLCMNKQDFLVNVLVQQLGMKEIVCGSDFRFAYNREGNVEYLISESEKNGYSVKVFDKLKENKEIISSTKIRELISEGIIEEANILLNHPFKIKGQVVHGNEIGRTLKCPTANIIADNEKILPPNGVYFTKTLYNGKLYDSVTNIGIRPTVTDGESLVIETHILDFNGYIYDESIEVWFYKHHRNEQRFSSKMELIEMLNSDILARREYTK